MKFNININQKAAVDNGFDIDVIDLAIFDFIKDFGGSHACSKIQTNKGLYFWIAHKKIIEQLPLIKIKTSQGIIKRIENLINCGLLEKHPNCEHYGKSLYRFGKNYDLMLFTPLNENLAPPKREFIEPLNESLGNNNINNNNKTNNLGETPAEQSPAVSYLSKSFKKWTKEEFSASIKEAREKRKAETKKPNFTTEMLTAFFAYWSEPDAAGKMRFQKQDTWATANRLVTWEHRNKN